MRKKKISLHSWISWLLILAIFVSGCSKAPASGVEPTKTSAPTPTEVVSTPTPEPTQDEPVVDPNVLFHDDFTNPSSGWPEAKFDNFFIGYHEPEYYHVEISSPNYKTTVFEPKKENFGDVTIKVKVFTASSRTAETGDFSFGPAFRRSGDQYYAFTISQRTKEWYVLKSTPNALTVLAEGTDESIHDPDAEDDLRVDAKGADFSFYINDQLVDQVTDADYASGEIGFFVQTFDATQVHIHFDDISISKFEGVQPQGSKAILYHDDFTNPASNWPEEKFDNFFIGYHEPEYYHIEITSPNYKTTVFGPDDKVYGDASIEVKAFTASSRTAETGDYSFGPVFRRSGDQYYAFTISPRTKKWYMLKSTPNALRVLAQGTDESIHEADEDDVLRVDVLSSKFTFYVNDQIVGQVLDSDYSSGEIGFFVQTFDAKQVHIHFDELTISAFEPLLSCDVKAQALNVRSGPGTGYSSSAFLAAGEVVQPIERSNDGAWLLIAIDAGNNQSWIFYDTGYLSCNGSVDVLPVTPP
jgi:hypothetical protein